MQRASLPVDVLGVVGDQRPDCAMGKGASYLGQAHSLAQHQDHHQAAECIQRENSRRAATAFRLACGGLRYWALKLCGLDHKRLLRGCLALLQSAYFTPDGEDSAHPSGGPQRLKPCFLRSGLDGTPKAV